MLAAQVGAEVTALAALITADPRQLGFLKQAADAAVLQLSQLPKDLEGQVSAFVEQDQTVNLCLAGLTSPNKKAIELSLSCINKLVVQKAVGPSQIPGLVTRVHRIVYDESDQSILFKAMQILVALWTTKPLYHLASEDVAKCLAALFRLATSRTSAVHQAGDASLRQVIMEMFDSISLAQQKNDASTAQASCYLLDLCRLVKDVCNLTAGQDPVWLPSPLSFGDIFFGFDILDELLSHPTAQLLFVRDHDMIAILKDKVFPLLIQSMHSTFGSSSVYSCVRVLRAVTPAVIHFHGVVPLSTAAIFDGLFAIIDSTATDSTWSRILALSSFRAWFTQPQFVRETYSSHPKLMEKLLSKLSLFSQTMFSWDSAEFVVGAGTSLSHTSLHIALFPVEKLKFTVLLLHCLDTSLVGDSMGRVRLFPQMKPSSPELPMFCQTPSAVVLSTLQIVLSILDIVAFDAGAVTQAQQQQPAERIAEFIGSSWTSVLAMLSLFISKSRNEAFLQLVLRGYQNFTRCCALLKASTPRDAFLTSLCKFAKPLLVSSPTAGVGMGVVAELEKEGLSGTAKLTKKNVLTMKTLLNISHTLAPVLTESAWAIVLDTLHQLFVILSVRRRSRPSDTPVVDSSAKTSALESDSPGSESVARPSVSADPFGANFEEEDMLFTTLDSLFSSTRFMDERGLVALVVGLIALSRSRLSELVSSTPLKDAAAQHLFPLSKAFQLVSSDLSRVSLVWDAILHHVVADAATHRNPDVRLFAAQHLTQIIREIVSNPLFHDESSNKMQERCLEALEQLVTQCVHPEVRTEAVDSLFRILQSCGPSLNAASWSVVLSLLMAVGLDTSDAAVLSLGFKCAQLIVADFLGLLPVDSISVAINMVGCYAGKSIVDVNINITAVGLLWNIADSLSKDESRILVLEQEPRQADAPPTSPNARLARELNLWDSLWYALLQELVARADNRRSEIRNAALQTLFGCLYAYGGKCLSSKCWSAVWPQVLLPLLPWIIRSSSSASSDGIVPESAGMLVDHARNTELKLWHETHVVVINGLVKVFKTFFEDVLLPQESLMETVSDCLLSHLELVLLRSDRPFIPSLDVLAGCVVALKDIILAAYVFSKSDSVKHAVVSAIVERCWLSWLATTRMLRRSITPISHRILNTFVDSISEIFPKLPAGDVHCWIAACAELPLFPVEFAGELLILQKQVLSLILSAVEGPLGCLVSPKGATPRLHVAAVLLAYLARAIGVKYTCSCFTPVSTLSKLAHAFAIGELFPAGVLAPQRREFPLAERSLAVLSTIWNHLDPETEKCILFPDVAAVCSEAMLIRHDPVYLETASTPTTFDVSKIWMSAETFLRVCLPECLPVVSQFVSQIECSTIWTNLIDSIEAFILAAKPKESATDNAVSADIAWLGQIRSTLIPCCPADAPSLHSRLFAIILEACNQVDRERIVEVAFDAAFAVTSDMAASQPGIAQLLLPMLIRRSIEIISQFVADDQRSGALPLPVTRMRQVLVLFAHLSALRLPPSVWESPHVVPSVNNSQHRHLYELYPVLCECITVREREVQVALKSIFMLVGTAFQQTK